MTLALFDQLSVLSEPLRARILRLLALEELAVGELARVIQTSQPTISRHLKHLTKGSFIESRKVGTSTWVHAPVSRYAGTQAELWSVIEQATTADATDKASVFAADLRRLEVVLASRDRDSATMFARLGSRWDALRTEQFGVSWLPALAMACVNGHRGVQHIADLGCGTGHLLPLLASTGAQVTGIDREEAMLTVARDRIASLDNVRLRAGLLGEVPLADGSVDLTTVAFVLHHIRNLQPVFADVARVLAPGGRAVLVDMVAHDRTDFCKTMGHVHQGFSEAQIGQLAAGAGLEMTRFATLPPDENALGPALFVAVLTASPAADSAIARQSSGPDAGCRTAPSS